MTEIIVKYIVCPGVPKVSMTKADVESYHQVTHLVSTVYNPIRPSDVTNILPQAESKTAVLTNKVNTTPNISIIT